MKVKNVKFITSISDIRRYNEVRETLPAKELCVVGRSNVGKSSFINMLAGNGKLAKTSATPGRTRLINLFSFNDGQFILTDLPGYGYAAAAKSEKNKWGELIEGYLTGSDNILRVLVLVDSRHEPTVLDKQMIDYLYYYGIPFSVVATKTDKLSKSKIPLAVRDISAALAVGRDDIIAVSSVTGSGKDAVLRYIEEKLNADATAE